MNFDSIIFELHLKLKFLNLNFNRVVQIQNALKMGQSPKKVNVLVTDKGSLRTDTARPAMVDLSLTQINKSKSDSIQPRMDVTYIIEMFPQNGLIIP